MFSLIATALAATTPLHTLEGALSTLEHLDFDGWLAHHGKQYTVEEHATRKVAFEASKKEGEPRSGSNAELASLPPSPVANLVSDPSRG